LARQRFSGGKARHGRIAKRGVRICEPCCFMVQTRRWVFALQERRGFNKVVVALAVKHTRILLNSIDG